MIDGPQSLRSVEHRAARLAAIDAPHVASLSEFVHQLRATMGSAHEIPYFDPHDGGTRADCLFLLEAPGPNAVASGFISRNPDETAKNFYLLNEEAGIPRQRSVVWNIVPWYIGSGIKIRPANLKDLGDAEPALVALLLLLPNLHSIVLVGQKAASKRENIAKLVPSAKIYTISHPSPLYVNRSQKNRAMLLESLREVAQGLPGFANSG